MDGKFRRRLRVFWRENYAFMDIGISHGLIGTD